ncbi:tmRNA-binding protein SmpB [Candidatus Nasuia deltocephalinicola]|uniref:TmRNA-binding protein SmpB n=1 Tax=Candidatus Nasuia deltocephalincola TaxID=1160784 RepID=A0A7G6UHQ8_9PROT|nr:tmRNA-binding protein SmpB [Candidatus Nasuia deltocephalinicola]
MLILKNKFVNNNYILKILTAGLILKGWEVKQIKCKYIDIKNSFIFDFKKEIFIKNFLISNEKNNYNNRNIKLLLNKREIKEILIKLKKFKILPFEIFLIKHIIKVNIVVVLNKNKNIISKCNI